MGGALGPIETLHQAGFLNPKRLPNLIKKTIDFLDLNLKGLTILTEAASGPYVVTPIIAAMAGAEEVLALTNNSPYASVESVIDQTRALAILCGVEPRIKIHTQRSMSLFSQADIVTNLGFVRPIDEAAVHAMKTTAVIPLMCESWEFRPGDVDMVACKQKGIPVVGTNEDFPGLEVFGYSGWLCIKMLFEAQIEIHKSKLLIISSDKFGRVIEQLLKRLNVDVQLVSNGKEIPIRELHNMDAIIVADYSRYDTIIGPGGDFSAEELANEVPDITIITFAGLVDYTDLTNRGLVVFPNKQLEARRMAKTLSDLGPRPVIELHAAGLKVGSFDFTRTVKNPFENLADNKL